MWTTLVLHEIDRSQVKSRCRKSIRLCGLGVSLSNQGEICFRPEIHIRYLKNVITSPIVRIKMNNYLSKTTVFPQIKTSSQLQAGPPIMGVVDKQIAKVRPPNTVRGKKQGCRRSQNIN